MHILLVIIPTQLPILAVLLFSTLCLFLVAEAKDLYKVRRGLNLCAWEGRTSIFKQEREDADKRKRLIHSLSLFLLKQILGVKKTATEAQLKKQYRKVCLSVFLTCM